MTFTDAGSSYIEAYKRIIAPMVKPSPLTRPALIQARHGRFREGDMLRQVFEAVVRLRHYRVYATQQMMRRNAFFEIE